MTITYHHDASSTHELSGEHSGLNAPWIPLDALIERWAAFGKEATTVFATRATGTAFAALTEERTALRHYTAASKEWQCDVATCWSQMFNEHECAINALTQAAAHWFDVAYAVECHTATCSQADEVTQRDLHALLAHALEQRLRVWTIAHHLLHEQVMHYHQYHVLEAGTLREEIPR